MKVATLVLYIGYMFVHVDSRCPQSVVAPLSFVVEYAVWRGWHQALIYTPDLEQDCEWTILRLVKCLGVNGVASTVGVQSTTSALMRTLLGIVVQSPRLNENSTNKLSKLVKQLHELKMNTASYDWLIMARSAEDFKLINDILNATSIRFDQNIIVAYPHNRYYPEIYSRGLCDTNFIYKKPNIRNATRRTIYHGRRNYYNNCRYDKNCVKTEYERNYYRTSERFRNLTRNKTYKRDGNVWPLMKSGLVTHNISKQFHMLNISKFYLRQQYNKWRKQNNIGASYQGIHVLQYFKVRINSTLYAYYLGSWNIDQSMSGLETPYTVEGRNFLGEVLVVGRCNATGDALRSVDDEGPSDPSLLDDVVNFLSIRLNSTSMISYYSKLGFRTYEGAWTGLLGALTDNSVDIALEPVTAHSPRHQDMDFIFPIAETICNIYIRQQETSTVRDIFLAPFSPRLLVCVLAVALVAAIAVVLINRLTPSLRNESRSMGYTEALLWSTGILCQQGGTWTPSNPAASVVLIVCLFFAVVTYNAYAAFITSVLSVRVASVDTIAAVLHSPDFKIGYIRNGADQMYLMSTKDAQLNAFYIRGYSDAENLVSSAEEGLARAAKQDYAFFAGQRAARSTLRSLSQARGRCAVRELPVPTTRAQIAFPLPRLSPYARSILVSLLQLRSGGSLARLGAALVPDMPQCAPPPGFASARAADVRSALIIFLIGFIAAPLLESKRTDRRRR